MELDRDYYDRLTTVTRESTKVQRSEFLAVAAPVDSEAVFFGTLEKLKKEKFDATHHCWAFRIFAGGSIENRSSDAGEPSGTAGRPILQAIEDADLLDAAVVVVRYYGGVKLGTGGLARAYRDAARIVLRRAPRTRTYLYERIECAPGFERMSQIYRLVAPPDVVLVEERYEPEPTLVLDIRKSMAETIITELRAQRILAEARD